MPLLERSEKVDSCLTVLKSIDTTALTRPADKARWSLLYAMALDKNYIDTTDLSVLQPAIDRYTHWIHLNRLDKFYTWYYKGRIEENARIFDASLDSYLHAERYMKATDDVYRTRLYFGFERVYMKTLSFKDAEEAVKMASYYALLSGNKHNIIESLSDCSIHSSNRGDFIAAKQYLSKCEELVTDSDVDNIGKYFNAKMIYFYQNESLPIDSSLYYMNAYLESSKKINPLSCAITCIKNSRYKEARYFLEQYDTTSFDSYDFKYSYYYCRSRVKESAGDYVGALMDLHKQDNLIDKDYMYNVDNEIPFSSEKYHYQLFRLNVLVIVVTVLFLVVVIFLVLTYEIKMKKRELTVMRQNYAVLLKEYEYNQRIQARKQSKLSHKIDDVSRVWQRIIVIGNNISGRDDLSLVDAIECIHKRSEAKEFEGVINMLGSIHCNKFYTNLSERGLDVFEIAYCFLCLELSTKELEYILRRKNLYNVNAFIKEKLAVIEKSRIQKVLIDLYYSVNRG